MRVHLEAAANGLIPDADAAARLAALPEIPNGASDLWERFLELHGRRSWDENGPVRFAWADIEAYLGVTQSTLTFWELSQLFAIEDVYFKVYAENKPK